jgi:glycosyl hydrolase family 39 (putative alpha-L-iduronidase)
MANSRNSRRLVLLALAVLAVSHGGSEARGQKLPSHLIPRRSSQIHDGFGINSDLPRDPYIPWNRWWWTRIFDAGINFIRIGQYENSSDYTSWDWVERKRGEYSIPAEVDDQVNSLVENGMHIAIQLLYGNVMYTSPVGRRPQSSTPEAGGFHNPDRNLYSVFWPPKSPEQIEAFSKYVTWMVKHFHGRVQYYEVWNEPNIDYWNPVPSPEEYGRLFKAVAPVIRAADPNAKVIFGALAGADLNFAKAALDACNCGESIDIFAYHIYPNYGHNLNPEALDDEHHLSESPKALREMVQTYPGIRKDLVFWNDEFNSIPSWEGSDESVQAKYIPRGLLADRAAGVRTFVWLIVGATDGNESDDFGMLHGMLLRPEDFTPRSVFSALQNTATLFSDTTHDPSIQVHLEGSSPSAPLVGYGFRSANNKAIVAYWLPVLSKAGDTSPAAKVTLKVTNSSILNPVLVDVTSGEMIPLSWKSGTSDTLDEVPLKDSVMAIVDEEYFDWMELPEAPSELILTRAGRDARLTWRVHGGNAETVSVERRAGDGGPWQSVAKLPASQTSFVDKQSSNAHGATSFRVAAENRAGRSAYSNVARRPE